MAVKLILKKMTVCQHIETACERFCIDISKRHDATCYSRPRGITQRAWRQAIGGTDERSQRDGSRNSDGNVLNVNWNSDDQKVQVNWYNLDNSDSKYGLRSEVSATKPCLIDGVLSEIFDPPIRHF